MISLSQPVTRRFHRTRVIIRLMPPLLLELWRELHPKAHEQTALNFSPVRLLAEAVPCLDLWKPLESAHSKECSESCGGLLLVHTFTRQ